MTLVNSSISYTGYVEKYIGSGYDTVAYVAANIEQINEILKFINGEDYPQLVELAEYIEKYLSDVLKFHATYYGALPADPTLDPLGDPVTEGDIYFNTVDGYLKSYNGFIWFRLGVVEQTRERFTTHVQHISGSWAVFPLSNPYIVGSNNLTVYLNGRHLAPSSPGIPGEYIEMDSYHFKIATTQAAIGTTVDTVIGTDVATVQHVVKVDVHQVFTHLVNQALVDLPAGNTYVPNVNNLDVYMDRKLLLSGLEYTETDPTRITLLLPSTIGTEIVFKVGQVLASVPQDHKVLMQSVFPDPAVYSDGQLWFNTSTARMYIMYTDQDSVQWVSVSGEEEILYPGTPPDVAPPAALPMVMPIVQATQPNPDSYPEGTLWLNNTTGELFFLYRDVNSNQWLKVSAA